MPLYEYRCPECRESLTIRQDFDDESAPSCATCGDQPMRRVVSCIHLVKSEQERIRDLSWVDKNLAARIKKKASRPLSSALQDAVDRMESH